MTQKINTKHNNKILT